MNFDQNIPIYLQLMTIIESEIAAGKYNLGDKLPTRREVAMTYKVNPNTVQRAFKELEDKKIIETQGNIGSTVTKDPDLIQKLKENILKNATEEFILRVKPLNINHQQLKNYLIDFINHYKEGNSHD